jgi:hypothetical protein
MDCMVSFRLHAGFSDARISMPPTGSSGVRKAPSHAFTMQFDGQVPHGLAQGGQIQNRLNDQSRRSLIPQDLRQVLVGRNAT